MFKLALDTATFISEIEKRPAIWQKCLTHVDGCKRQRQWKEIVEIYSDKGVLTAAKKTKLGEFFFIILIAYLLSNIRLTLKRAPGGS